ncbi:MAG: hypothetical protein KA236_16005 [Verrucomicrobia bacterium]|jgi:hypothetical protein|nr:hypothetical protein [Verrucomicrobiota bacterium]
MKKLFVLTAAGLMAASTLLAVEIGQEGVIYTKDLGPYQAGRGGEFTLIPESGFLDLSGYAKEVYFGIDNRETFQSFCLETREYIYKDDTYKAKVASAALAGGVSDPKGDPISIGTSWLYSQFATGQLENYVYEDTDKRLKSADQLQVVIWWLEDEMDEDGNLYKPASDNPFLEALIKEFDNEEKFKSDAKPGENGVYVLQLRTGDGDPRQDVLYYQTPTGGGGGVPDGGFTLLLLGSAMAGLSVVRRKLG